VQSADERAGTAKVRQRWPVFFDLAEQWIGGTPTRWRRPSAAPGHLMADRVVIENRLAAKGEVT
jgi:hypothetical protein